MNIIYTLGHSNHSLEFFTSLLHTFDISCVVDVRSSPRSKLFPHYNEENLRGELKSHGITYLSFSDEFGARVTDPSMLNDGQVDFQKVRKAPFFLHGINRLKDGLNKGFTIVLLCAEAEPLDCHRFSMISYQLVREDFRVLHILKNGKAKTNSEVEKELLQWYATNFENPLLDSGRLELESIALEKAYILKNHQIGYRPNSLPNNGGHDRAIHNRIYK